MAGIAQVVVLLKMMSALNNAMMAISQYQNNEKTETAIRTLDGCSSS